MGALFTHRSRSEGPTGANQAFGVDASLGFFDNLFLYSYWAHGRVTWGRRLTTPAIVSSLTTQAIGTGCRLSTCSSATTSTPAVGFVRRDDMRRSYAQFRFSPRPASSDRVRKYAWTGSLAYVEDGAGRLETREADGEFAVEFQNSDRFSIGVRGVYEFLPIPFPIATTVTLPVGEYDYGTARIGYDFGRQRSISANVLLESGTFYDGHLTALSVSRGRYSPLPQLSFEPTTSMNWIRLGSGEFTRTLAGARVTYTATPMMFASALVQYNSSTHTLSTNARLRWEYQPGSELFVVYNDEQDTRSRRVSDRTNRALVIKINRLFRF